MEFQYPKMTNYLIAKRRADRRYQVKNVLKNTVFIMDPFEYFFLTYLNGINDPYDYPALENYEIEETLKKFIENDLVRFGTKMTSGMSTFYIPRKTKAAGILPAVFNLLLILTFLPVFGYGLYTVQKYMTAINTNSHYFLGLVFGLLLSSIVHEVSHAVACLSYGGYFFEFGFLINILPGIYALIDYSNVERRLRRVQIIAAGIEGNLLLAGLNFILAANSPFGSGLFFWIGAVNVVYAALNLSTMGNLDGSALMEELFGMNGNTLSDLYWGRSENIHAKNNRLSGYASLITAISLAISRFIIPLVLVAEVIAILL